MCIIVYKPTNVAFPKKKILRACFDNNPDGAGFMYAADNKVHILKGFMGFSAFNKALKQVRLKYGENIPYVLHFRISTQAGVNQRCCHPYPLSKNMQDLTELTFTSDIGVAHNGIISLTSSYSRTAKYNDTMEFITEYLSLIIKDRKFYKNEDTLALIEKLAESKLAILDGSGKCTLIGHFIEDDGVYYSNANYKPVTHTAVTTGMENKNLWGTAYSPYNYGYGYGYSAYGYNYEDEISIYNCGYENFGDYSHCAECLDKDTCPQYVEYLEEGASLAAVVKDAIKDK